MGESKNRVRGRSIGIEVAHMDDHGQRLKVSGLQGEGGVARRMEIGVGHGADCRVRSGEMRLAQNVDEFVLGILSGIGCDDPCTAISRCGCGQLGQKSGSFFRAGETNDA